ncbi:YgiQ family radical SAM protein, partial [Pseudomonas syringae]
RAEYGSWRGNVRTSLLIVACADILRYGKAVRASVEAAQRLSYGHKMEGITEVGGTAFIRRGTPQGWYEVDSTRSDRPGKVDKIINPYVNTQDTQACAIEQEKGNVEDPHEAKGLQSLASPHMNRDKPCHRMPSQ